MTTIECGPFAYLEESLVKYLSSHRPGPGRRVAVVTTSQRMAERLQRLLTLERGISLLNLQFLTLHSLSLDVLRSAGVALPVVNNDDLFHERLVESLLLEDRVAPERARALAGAHWATVKDLVEAGVDGASFREHFGDLEVAGKEKLDRLLALADRYRERLKTLNVAGSWDLARRAAAVLDERPEVIAGFDELLYYGFYDLNGAQSDFFSAVARSSPIRVYFPCVKGSPGWAFSERFLDLKLPLGGAHLAFGPSSSGGVLGALADLVFDPGQYTAKAGGDVRILNVSGERDEVWRVAKEIVRLREGEPSLGWDDIGVVARGVEGYSLLVQEIFAAHGIPFSLFDGGPFIAHPAARLAANMADIRSRRHDRDALLDVLSSPLLRADIFPPDAVRAAREHLLREGPRAGLSHLLSAPMQDHPVLKELGRRLAADLSTGVASWSVHSDSLRRRLESVMDPGLISERESITGLLSRLSEWDRFSPPVYEEEFASAWADLLRRARAPGTGAVHGVRVMGAMEARGEPFRVLFLIGLKEGVFPRVVREDPLLSDDLRRSLRDPGGYWILPKREGYEEEKLLFTLLVSSAQERLYLSYSRSGEDGRAEVPSLYLRNFARAAGLDLETGERLPRSPLEKWKALPPSLLTPLEASLADVLEDRVPPGPLGEAVQWAEPLAGWGAPGPWDGTVGPPTGYLERCSTKGLSPSAVETLASCPFEFFLSRLLNLREPASFFDEEGVLPGALGTLQHEALHHVYSDFIAHGLPDPDEAARRVLAAVEKVFADRATSGVGPYPLLWRTVQDRVARDVAGFVRRDVARLKAEGARPEKLEWALKAPMPGTPFVWSGRVDRVDWSPATRRWTVVDYKNKKRKEPLLKRVLAGQVFQAPAYLDLVGAQNEWGSAAAPAGVRYEFLATNETDVLTADDWSAHGTAIEKSRAALLSLLTKGLFPIRPTEGPGAHCGYCDFGRVCRKAHGPSRKRAEGGVGPLGRPRSSQSPEVAEGVVGP